jgi:hypothetical protein
MLGWEHCTLDNHIFGCDKIYYSFSIIVNTCMQTLIPNSLFENVFPTYFSINPPN